MKISIIIPTYNEAANIEKLIDFLLYNSQDCEIIVSDGQSEDNTLELASAAGAIAITSPQRGRAAQMNYGASLARGEVLYFIHADSIPPAGFRDDIIKALEDGFRFGRYRTRFNSKKLLLKLNAFFTRFDLFICYGGDQTLFITKKLFRAIGGFNTDLQLMEDYDIVGRAKSLARYKIMEKAALISARKYDHNSWLTVQRANYKIVQMYKKGVCQTALVEKYKDLLN